MGGGRRDDERPSTGLWVANGAILATNAAVITALDPGAAALAVMAAVTALLALGSALTAWARRNAGPISGPDAPRGRR